MRIYVFTWEQLILAQTDTSTNGSFMDVEIAIDCQHAAANRPRFTCLICIDREASGADTLSVQVHK